MEQFACLQVTNQYTDRTEDGYKLQGVESMSVSYFYFKLPQYLLISYSGVVNSAGQWRYMHNLVFET